MSKERLEELKEQFRWGLANLYRGRDNLDDADIEYLFQQAEEKIQLEERVKDLIHENTEIRKGYRERSKRVKELEALSLSLGSKNKRYKQTLEFYADKKTYDRAENGPLVYVYNTIESDCGDKARQTLQGGNADD